MWRSQYVQPEQTNRDTKRPDTARIQPLLGLDLAVLVELRLQELPQVEEVERDDDEGADEDAEEGEAFGAQAEAVDADEDGDEGLEPDVEQAVDEGDVEVEEEDLGRWLV